VGGERDEEYSSCYSLCSIFVNIFTILNTLYIPSSLKNRLLAFLK